MGGAVNPESMVWVVVKGEQYEGGCVEGVFATRERALAYALAVVTVAP